MEDALNASNRALLSDAKASVLRQILHWLLLDRRVSSIADTWECILLANFQVLIIIYTLDSSVSIDVENLKWKTHWVQVTEFFWVMQKHKSTNKLCICFFWISVFQVSLIHENVFQLHVFNFWFLFCQKASVFTGQENNYGQKCHLQMIKLFVFRGSGPPGKPHVINALRTYFTNSVHGQMSVIRVKKLWEFWVFLLIEATNILPQLQTFDHD